jgi:hypothetical protein
LVLQTLLLPLPEHEQLLWPEQDAELPEALKVVLL